MKNIIIIFAFVFFLFSCGNENDKEDDIVKVKVQEEELSEEAELTENERNYRLLLRKKDVSATTSEKLLEIAIKAKGDYKRLACLFKCSPSVIKRLIEEKSFPTLTAIEQIDASYDIIINKGNDLDYVNDCKEVKWTNKIFGKPDYLEWEDKHTITLNEVWETVYLPNQESFEEARYSVNKLKLFELENNVKFQNQLIESSVGYFENVVEDFLDNEYGINGSLRELKDQVGKTDKERFDLWQARIKHYFSSIGYMSWVKSEIDTFSTRINNQRRLILENEYGFTSTEKVNIKKHYLKPFSVNDKIILKAKEKSENDFKNSLEEGIALVLTAHPYTSQIGLQLDRLLVLEFVIETGIEVVLPSKEDTKTLLTNAYKEFLNNLEFNYTESFNSNTEAYYNELLSVIENRQNEKIKI